MQMELSLFLKKSNVIDQLSKFLGDLVKDAKNSKFDVMEIIKDLAQDLAIQAGSFFNHIKGF